MLLGFAERSLSRISLPLVICNSFIYIKTALLYVHCSSCTYCMSQGLCASTGRGSEGLLWQREVSQRSLHYKLDSNIRPQADLAVRYRKPCILQLHVERQWHSNSSHRRDYLTFLGAGGSNVTWFWSRGETTSWFIKRCPAQYLEFPQYIFCTPKWNQCRLQINFIKTYASRWLLLVTRSCQSALRCMSEVQVSWHKSALCV